MVKFVSNYLSIKFVGKKLALVAELYGVLCGLVHVRENGEDEAGIFVAECCK